jgi:imidazole glycerol-phosphate synthase subunit HisH
VSDVAVVDLGLGNLGSVLQALTRAGGQPRLARDADALARSRQIVVPGVAAFGLGMERANALRLGSLLRDALGRGAAVLAICLGMQILFEEGDEDGTQAGLGLLPGRVTKLPAGVQTPHIGWQKLELTSPSPLLKRPPWTYFAHSYRCEAPPEVTHAVADHGGVRIAAIVGRGKLFGVQFHPEKSARDGQDLLARFLRLET